MPNIKPVSDLRNYNDVLLEVKKDSPVYLTRNGRGVYAVIAIDDYEKMQAEIKLFSELKKGIDSAEKDGWVSGEDARKQFEL